MTEKMISQIINGDCLEVLKKYPDNHFTSIITDPPYGLSFMGKKWDYEVPSVDIWKECLRVLKPGGTALIFAGSRTQHRMAVNVEDAGFILKDCLMYLYGSGFPKSTRINLVASRYLLKDDACQCDERKHNNDHTFPLSKLLYHICKYNGFEEQAEGVSQNVQSVIEKPQDFLDDCPIQCRSYDELPHLLSRVSLTFLQRQEYVQEHNHLILPYDEMDDESLHNLSLALYNALPSMQDYFLPSFCRISYELRKVYEDVNSPSEYLNICASRLVGSLDFSKLIHGDKLVSCILNIPYLVFCLPLSILLMLNSKKYKSIIPQMKICLNCFKLKNKWEGYGTSLKPAYEPVLLAMKPNDGTYANNALKHGVSGINIEKARIPLQGNCSGFQEQKQGRFPSNLILDEEAAKLLDEQTNNASRFFYCAKTSKAERNAGCEELIEKDHEKSHFATSRLNDLRMKNDQKRVSNHNHHPTVKPLSLMKYLINLIMPPTNGLLLDPFAGSGSTIVAATSLGYDSIGIELQKEYCEIARKRVEHEKQKPQQLEI